MCSRMLFLRGISAILFLEYPSRFLRSQALLLLFIATSTYLSAQRLMAHAEKNRGDIFDQGNHIKLCGSDLSDFM